LNQHNGDDAKKKRRRKEKKESNHVRDLYVVTPLAAIKPTSPVATAKCYRALRKQQFIDLTD
jgi:hypothetical protein